MAPAILLCEDPEEPIEIKKSIGMGHIWDKMKKGAVRQKSTSPPTDQNPNGGHSISQHAVSDTSFLSLSPASSPASSHALRNPALGPKDKYFSDITKYIPAGCIRIHKHESSITGDEFFSCQNWQAFHLPTDFQHFQDNISYLPNTIQGKLFRSASLVDCIGIHDAGWIRMEFKARDQRSGQVRVYLLPDDIGRGVLDRSTKKLRKGVQSLLDKLDISKATWQGTWSDDTPIQHIDPGLNADQSINNMSLFDIFNTLPSPKPDPNVVIDEYVRDTMRSILESNVQGLHPDTQMHLYQCRTAAMMLQRETQPAYLLDPRLRKIEDQAGNNFYCDLSAGICLREPRFYEAPRGGICAENMGLGKTLICLALILSTKEFTSQIPVEHSVGSIPVRITTGSLLDMAASAVGRLGIPWEIELRKVESQQGLELIRVREALHKGIGYYWHSSDPPRRLTRHPVSTNLRKVWLSKTTLVVVPANLVQQWILEIEKHTTGMAYLVMDDMMTLLPAAYKLATYDLILFSKRRFDKEASEATLHIKQSTTTCEGCFGDPDGPDCHCPNKIAAKAPYVYRSPLKDLRFKRLIADEGHSFGNATKTSFTDAMTVVKFLHVDARWIISGTPTHGLYGTDITSSVNNETRGRAPATSHITARPQSTKFDASSTKLSIEQEQEEKDLEKLGNILASYLKVQPWANMVADGDEAAWKKLVVDPRYNRVHGDSQILKTTLESMIIRHTAKDVNEQLSLPPLHKKVVYLNGSFQDKLSLNIFSMMIAINAVTSEREGVDYLFHLKSRGALVTLVSNLRQASFTWSGYTTEMIQNSLDIARKFLSKDKTIEEDKKRLEEAIRVGEIALKNGIFTAVSRLHQMAMYVQNPLQKDIRRAWSLDYHDGNPTLMGASMVIGAKEAFNECSQNDSLYQSSWKGKTLKHGEKMMKIRELENRPQVRPADVHQAFLNNLDHRPKERPFDVTDNKMWTNSVIISTASSKLSYLMDQIFIHHHHEKIIVFYEAENVGYYISEALKCMNVEFLVYTKRDSTSERSKCVVKFNSITAYRVMLMDVKQAAFGLDMSAASRVYFVNPVFSPQIEAQAIKRAHRIGQLRPVHVETLVLKGSIEEVILTRRGTMSDQEHMNLKTILDDQTIYDWIRNIPFYHISGGKVPGPEQLAPLNHPQLAFTHPRRHQHKATYDSRKEKVISTWHSRKGLLRVGPNSSSEHRVLFPYESGVHTSSAPPIPLSARIPFLPADVQLQIWSHYIDGIHERMHYRQGMIGAMMNDIILGDNAFTSGDYSNIGPAYPGNLRQTNTAGNMTRNQSNARASNIGSVFPGNLGQTNTTGNMMGNQSNAMASTSGNYNLGPVFPGGVRQTNTAGNMIGNMIGNQSNASASTSINYSMGPAFPGNARQVGRNNIMTHPEEAAAEDEDEQNPHWSNPIDTPTREESARENPAVVRQEDEGPSLPRRRTSHGTQLRAIFEDEEKNEDEDWDGDHPEPTLAEVREQQALQDQRRAEYEALYGNLYDE